MPSFPRSLRALPGLAALAALLVALAAAPAAAQLRVQLGGGLARPVSDFSDLVDSGYQGRVGVQLGFPLLPLSLRAEGEASRFPAAELSDGHATLLGANVSAVLGLGGLGVSPYILAGVGTYRTSFSDAFPDRETTTGAGYHGGVGLDLGILGFGGFVEARFVNVSRDGGDVRTIPLTVGVRF